MTTGKMQPSRDVTAIGEGQLRLNTRLGTSLEVANDLAVHVAGAEGNVLGLLSRLGNRTGLVTSLPTGSLGRRIAGEYRTAGVDTSAIVWRETGRVALYFVETSTPPVPSRVTYDRADSCFARLTRDDIDWDYLGDARLLHVTGITAALSEGLYACLTEAVAQAHRHAQAVSVDVNYRSQLTTPERALKQLTPLLDGASIISCSRRDAATVFGLFGPVGDVATALSNRFGARWVLVSDGACDAAAYVDGTVLLAKPPATTVVDRVGAGDALIGGFLHGFLNEDPEQGLRLGIAAAALALTRHDDQVRTTLPDLEALTRSFGQDIVR
ncbi:sugar kinase [Amycolatopsis balhimycina]|nr:sugar kinase [Amycolatopsis balhimycina]